MFSKFKRYIAFKCFQAIEDLLDFYDYLYVNYSQYFKKTWQNYCLWFTVYIIIIFLTLFFFSNKMNIFLTNEGLHHHFLWPTLTALFLSPLLIALFIVKSACWLCILFNISAHYSTTICISIIFNKVITGFTTFSFWSIDFWSIVFLWLQSIFYEVQNFTLPNLPPFYDIQNFILNYALNYFFNINDFIADIILNYMDNPFFFFLVYFFY